MQSLKIEMTGVMPLLMHNGQMANPTSEIARAIRSISKKRNKTLEDHKTMARLEFEGSMYRMEHGKASVPCIPAINIQTAITNGAKQEKLGQKFKQWLLVAENCPLIYDGPKDVEGLWRNGRFVHQQMVRNPGQKTRVLRTRPQFPEWQIVPTVEFNDQEIEVGQVMRALDVAAHQGLCDSVPFYGRFDFRILDD